MKEKTKKLCLILCSTLVLSGCDKIDGFVENVKNNEKIQEMRQEDKERKAELKGKGYMTNLSMWRTEVEQLETDMTITYDFEGLPSFTRKVETTEVYDEGSISKYYVSMDDNGASAQFYFDGEKFYQQTARQDWVEDEYARLPFTYFTYLRFFFDGEDEWDYSMHEDMIRVSRKITDESLLEGLNYTLDIPYLTSPNASWVVNLTCDLDYSSGEIRQSGLVFDIVEVDKKHQIKLQATPKEVEKKDIVVNLEEDFSKKSEEDIQQKAKEVYNAYKPYFYQARRFDTVFDETTHEAVFINTTEDGFYRGVTGEVSSDNKFQATGLITSDKLYSYKDDKVEVSDVITFDPLKYFVERFANLEKLEKIVEEDGVTTYREFFDDDKDAFIEAARQYNLDKIVRDDAVYAIDYLIEEDTGKLSRVYFWSLLEDEEEIQVVSILDFELINYYTPSVFAESLPEECWQTLASN